MKKTVITDDLIVFSDGFVWKRLSRKVAEALWNSVISHELELYWVRTDDESEAAIEGFDDMERDERRGIPNRISYTKYNEVFI